MSLITVGVDIGSTASKAVVLENGNKILSKYVMQLGTGTRGPEEVFSASLEIAGIGIGDIDRIIATGYGRINFAKADKQVGEVSCHARGIKFLIPSVRTIIDIGGQDAKAMSVDETGYLKSFVMNDKCAAGTGRFLDVMANVLDIKTKDLGDISKLSINPVTISNTCTVFAESEVISRLSAGEKIEDIVAGIHKSVAKRVAGLILRVGVKDTVAMSGGVALNRGIVKALEKELKVNIAVHDDCQIAGAIGAAIYAWEDLQKK